MFREYNSHRQCVLQCRYSFKPGFHIIAPIATIAAVEKSVSATVAIYGNTLFNDSSDGSDDRR